MASSASTDIAALEGRVQAALGSLYQLNGTNVQEMQTADFFLRGFQLAPAAFNVCASLLDQCLQASVAHQNSRPLNPETVPSVFFAAQTLAMKLRRQPLTSTLDAATWVKRIVTWLSCNIRLPKMVVTQLLLALVATLPRLQAHDLYIDANQDTNRTADQYYAAIQATCVQSNGQSVVGYALVHLMHPIVHPAMVAEFLLLLVEEVDTLTDHSARQTMQDEVEAWAPTVLDQLLPQVMHEASSQLMSACADRVEVQLTVLRALTRWVQYVQIDAHVVVRNPLLQSLLSFLSRNELFDVSVDLAVQVVTSFAQQAVVVQWLTPRLLSLRGAFGVAADAADVDTCVGLCRIFTAMGEAYSESLPVTGTDYMALVDLLLDCMSYADAEVADVTIPFWFHLFDTLQRQHSALSVVPYQPRLMRLAGVCMAHLQFQADFPSWPADQQQDVKAFRQEVGDILRDCCHVLGVDAVLQHCVNGLTQIFHAPVDARKWEAVEAYLYCFRSIAREVETSKTNAETLDVLMSLIFQHLPQFANHPAICYTACLIVSRYATWLYAHASSLATLVNFLTTCVTKSADDPCYKDWQVARAAAAAVRALAIDCWSILGHDIVTYYLHIEQTAMMAVEDQVLILEGICIGVSRLKDQPRSIAVLDQVTKGIKQRLTALFASRVAATQVEIALNELLRLMCLYEYLDQFECQIETHPLVILTEQLWPLFTQMLTCFRSHDELVERVCRCYKRILGTCGHHLAPLLPQLVDNVLACYQAEPKSSYLYTASMVLKFFAPGTSSTEVDPLLAHMLFTLIETTRPIFASVNDMEGHPDVIEEFFYLIERAIRCVPQVLAAPVSALPRGPNCPLLTQILAYAEAALTIAHNDANKAVLCFLEQVFVQSEPSLKLVSMCASNTAVHEQGKKKLVSCLLQGVVLGTMSPSRVDADYGSIAGVLVHLATVNGPQLQQWIAEWFQQATAGTFATATVNFLTLDEALAFQKELVGAENERAFRRIIRHFGKLCASRNTSFKDCGR